MIRAGYLASSYCFIYKYNKKFYYNLKVVGSIMTEHIADSIREAQLVLVGLGEELDGKRILNKSNEYRQVIENVGNEWVIPYVDAVMLKQTGEDVRNAYKNLSACLKDKNYFVVSLCQDGWISDVGIEQERIVEPCGTFQKLQCSEGCHNELYDVSNDLLEKIDLFIKGRITEEELEQPICPKCGKPLVFNQVEAENYIEEGYLSKWQ